MTMISFRSHVCASAERNRIGDPFLCVEGRDEDGYQRLPVDDFPDNSGLREDTGARNANPSAVWDAEHFQRFDNRHNLCTRADGILHDVLEEFRGAPEWSRVIGDIVSSKNEPATFSAVSVDEALNTLNTMSALLQKVGR